MAETKHTPGPWAKREGTTTGAEVVAKKPRGGDYVVARCGGKDREGNARLIAAAPDLLAALDGLLEAYAELMPFANDPDDPDCPGVAVRSFAAIAKATGASNVAS